MTWLDRALIISALLVSLWALLIVYRLAPFVDALWQGKQTRNAINDVRSGRPQ